MCGGYLKYVPGVKAVQNMGDSFDRQMTVCVPKGGFRVLLTFNKMFDNVANSIQ